MNHQKRSFVRKVVYLASMALLLVPLSLLSRPATTGAGGESGGQGGLLSRLRTEHRLTQANLGKIDPTSSAMKLSTLGMRGVAANILWERAHYFQKTEDWASLQTTLDQISYLQPNFVSVWRFQAWNMSFNVSSEWDDYRDRYYYVIEGIKYLDRGQEYNQRDTRLLWDEAWFTGYKIGRCDEFRQFRLLFRLDRVNSIDSFLPTNLEQGEARDNWRVAKLTFNEAIQLVETRDVPVRGASPVLFFSEPAKCTIRYVAARESDDTVVEDGVELLRPMFGDKAKRWWDLALEEWGKFGERPFTSYSFVGQTYRMHDLDKYDARANEALEKLDALAPGLREQLKEKKKQALTKVERDLLEKPAKDLTDPEHQRLANLEERLAVSHLEVAQAVPEEKRAAAIKLAQEVETAQQWANSIRAQWRVVNFEYWRDRCKAEGSELGLEARELTHDAREAYRRDPFTAKEPYAKAFAKWNDLFEQYPVLMGDGDVGEDLILEVRRYVKALRAHDLKFSENNPWKNIQQLIKERDPQPPIVD